MPRGLAGLPDVIKDFLVCADIVARPSLSRHVRSEARLPGNAPRKAECGQHGLAIAVAGEIARIDPRSVLRTGTAYMQLATRLRTQLEKADRKSRVLIEGSVALI